jgi:hypothetical protein
MSKIKLTVGMPTHMDALGVWPTVVGLTMYHKEILPYTELLVVDQAPDTTHGHEVRGLLDRVRPLFANVKYVASPVPPGSAPAKERIFAEATGEYVLCIDSHVLLPAIAISRTMEYLAQEQHHKNDLFCGPMVYEDLHTLATHLDDVWSGNQWGTWAEARRCKCGTAVDISSKDGRIAYRLPASLEAISFDGCPVCGNRIQLVKNTGPQQLLSKSGFGSYSTANPALWGATRIASSDVARPFEVWAQGTGLLLARKDGWVGFTPHLKGFGAEEVLLHMRVRRAGGRVLCLPWLQWVHRFLRPDGVKYNLSQYHHIRNYVLGFLDLGLDLGPVYDHFVGLELHGVPLHHHLMHTHSVPESQLKDKSPKELETLHAQVSFPMDLWKAILRGEVDPPGKKKGGCVQTGDCKANGEKEQARTLPAYASLEDWYDHAHKTPHDINEHCPTLRQLASRCAHVTEFGKRHEVSTVALLAGVLDAVEAKVAPTAKLVSYNHFRYPESIVLKNMVPEHYEFRGGDSLKTVIEETDLLFIDTIHDALRIYKELKKHSPRVRRYIVMHDTATYGELGAGSQPPHHMVPGLLVGLRKFMREHPEWSVVMDFENNNGLTVISRQEQDKEQLPGVITMAWNYTAALAKHATMGGNASPEQLKRRLEICTLCPKRTGERCARCGCPVDEKASWAEQECPIGKWAREGV